MNDTTYTLTWTGMDGSEHETEYSDLDEALREATWAEERGAHNVYVTSYNEELDDEEHHR